MILTVCVRTDTVHPNFTFFWRGMWYRGYGTRVQYILYLYHTDIPTYRHCLLSVCLCNEVQYVIITKTQTQPRTMIPYVLRTTYVRYYGTVPGTPAAVSFNAAGPSSSPLGPTHRSDASPPSPSRPPSKS